MVIAYLIFGWIGGAAAALYHLTVADGGVLAACGLFVGVGNLTVLGLALLFAVRSLLATGQIVPQPRYLPSPVATFPDRFSDAQTGGHGSC